MSVLVSDDAQSVAAAAEAEAGEAAAKAGVCIVKQRRVVAPSSAVLSRKPTAWLEPYEWFSVARPLRFSSAWLSEGLCHSVPDILQGVLLWDNKS